MCAPAAAALTLAAGGSIKQALLAGVIAFAQMGTYSAVGGIVNNVAQSAGSIAAGAVKLGLHAIVGGAFSMAQGGSFQTGALTGLVSAGSSLAIDGSGVLGQSGDGVPELVAARTAIAAAAGGTASVLSGGKFANGAITGAFSQLYNGESRGKPGTQSGQTPKIGHNGGPPINDRWSQLPMAIGRGIVGLIAPLLMSGGIPYTLEEVIDNPSLLEGQHFDTASSWLKITKPHDANWVETGLGKGDHAGQGWIYREVLPNGEYSGTMIQYHPGSVRHFGGQPYWKVSNSFSDKPTVRVPAASKP
jgi:hypothetical protein